MKLRWFPTDYYSQHEARESNANERVGVYDNDALVCQWNKGDLPNSGDRLRQPPLTITLHMGSLHRKNTSPIYIENSGSCFFFNNIGLNKISGILTASQLIMTWDNNCSRNDRETLSFLSYPEWRAFVLRGFCWVEAFLSSTSRQRNCFIDQITIK